MNNANRSEQEIEQRQQIEAALQAGEERFRAQYRAIPVPTFIWQKTDDDFTLVDFNDAALAATRGKIVDLVGKRASDVYRERPDIVAQFRRCLAQRSVIREETRYRMVTTGEEKELILTYAFVPPDLVMVHSVDITDRVRTERALKREERLLRHLLVVQDRDRKLLAYELHDGLAQQLSGALMLLQAFRERAADNPSEAWKSFDAGLRTLAQAVTEVRRVIGGLRPPVLDESGVVAAIEGLVYEAQQPGGPQIEFAADVQFDRLEPILENAIFRIVQECLTNACRHSKSQKVSVRLSQRKDSVRVEVRDWGVGFDPAAVRGAHHGLPGIRGRARMLGGRAVVRSAPGQGTRVLVELPLVGPISAAPPSA